MRSHACRRPFAALVFAVASLLAFGIGAPVAGAAVAHASKAPAEWDRKLVPIVQQVEKLRGLTFEHPVKVEYLDEKAFQKRVAVDQDTLSAADKRQAKQSESTLRAAGLVAGDFDIVKSTSDLQESGVLAYYDPRTKRVTVRGTTLDVATRVTLAHELTHALQDQHFDLRAIERKANKANASLAAQALIEGDAVRVQRDYTAQLSDADQAEYDKTQAAQGADFSASLTSDAVPASLVALFQAPYALGPEMLNVVIAAKNTDAVNDLFRGAAKSDLSFLDPRSLLHDGKALKVTPPKLAAGEEQVGARDVFGAFGLYLLLATDGDPVRALDVADGWGTDSMVTFTRGQTTCVRAAFIGSDASASTAIHEGLTAWASHRTASATVDAAGDTTTLTTCDPGASAVDPGQTPAAALTVAEVRNALLAQAIGSVGEKTASCVAHRALGDASFQPLLAATVADPSAEPSAEVLSPFTKAVSAALADCRNT
jgi:hypothetical protein